jgi:hypothetical protein
MVIVAQKSKFSGRIPEGNRLQAVTRGGIGRPSYRLDQSAWIRRYYEGVGALRGYRDAGLGCHERMSQKDKCPKGLAVEMYVQRDFAFGSYDC